ncbi:hypothetical protein FBZ98_105135 [Rhizobium sp. ERR 922]|nr:hypothetical protein FBZ98_105135 [Rhizobium sp. ERR 922]TWB94077.1 hypothetical protein FBZ97_105135 [Rhizobium sp. ERR 942]
MFGYPIVTTKRIKHLSSADDIDHCVTVRFCQRLPSAGFRCEMNHSRESTVYKKAIPNVCIRNIGNYKFNIIREVLGTIRGFVDLRMHVVDDDNLVAAVCKSSSNPAAYKSSPSGKYRGLLHKLAFN